jgi:hypothetical protein
MQEHELIFEFMQACVGQGIEIFKGVVELFMSYEMLRVVYCSQNIHSHAAFS